MAAGRHGGYRYHEFRGKESGVEVSKREDLHHERRFRVGDGEQSRRGGGFLYGSSSGRLREIQEIEDLSSNSSGGGLRRSQFLDGSADRELGELSSGSGSDDPDVPQSKTRNNGVPKQENGSMPLSKKRKFSPIVWDRDDGKQSSEVPSRSKKEYPVDVSLPLPPPLPQGFVPCNSIEIVRHVELPSPREPEVFKASLPENLQNDDLELGQLEEEEEDNYALTPNILSSRWADGDDTFDDDDAEDFGVDFVPRKRKNTPTTDHVSSRSHRKVPTPEPGEFIQREGSDGSGSRSSHSGGEIGDTHQEFEIDKKDYMDVDEEDDNDDVDDHQLGSEAEGEHPPQRSINMLQGCRSVDEFERLNKIDEGTYGVVYRAKDKKTGEVVALKKVKMEKEREGFPLSSLREINILLSFHHPSIVDVKEVVMSTNNLDNIFMVMEYMEHELKGLMETMKHPFNQSEVKCLMLQLLDGVKYLHDNWVLHRDLKTSNILLNNHGELKICDFGLARQYGSPLKPYTQLVVTLWYRAPELLLGAREYSTAIDMWSLGCIMAELLAKEPLFGGKTEFDQLDKIFRTIGTPNEKIWPGFAKLPGAKVNFAKQPYNRLREKFPPTSFSGRPALSEAGFDLLNKLLTYDPERRITAENALNHEWFREVPLPKSKDCMPTFPTQHAQGRRLRRKMKSPDPLEEQQMKELQLGEIGTGSLFG